MSVFKIMIDQEARGKKTLLNHYHDFCLRQKGKEFLWYSISFITLIGSIMPISLITMYFTPWFFLYVFISMLLFFGNILTIIGRANIKTVITFYLATVAFNILVPGIVHLIIAINS